METLDYNSTTDADPSIKLNINDWKLRIRSDRKNRMKIHIDLNQEEAEAYKNFAEMSKPNGVTDNDFIKTIFMMGWEALHMKLAETVKRYALENKEELAASGISVVEGEDGEISLAETEALAEEE